MRAELIKIRKAWRLLVLAARMRAVGRAMLVVFKELNIGNDREAVEAAIKYAELNAAIYRAVMQGKKTSIRAEVNIAAIDLLKTKYREHLDGKEATGRN